MVVVSAAAAAVAAANCAATLLSWDSSDGAAVNSTAAGVGSLPLLLVRCVHVCCLLTTTTKSRAHPAPLSNTAQRVGEVCLGAYLPQHTTKAWPARWHDPTCALRCTNRDRLTSFYAYSNVLHVTYSRILRVRDGLTTNKTTSAVFSSQPSTRVEVRLCI